MNAALSTKVAQSSLLSQFRLRWATLASRERLGLSMATWVLGIGLLWWVALSPALDTLHAASTQRIALDSQLQQMQGLQNEAQALRLQPKLTSTEALKALEAAAKQRFGSAAQVTAVGDRVTVTLKGASPDALAQWLAQARANAHALPVEAKLTRSVAVASANLPVNTLAPTSAGWDGILVLRLP